MHPGKGSGSPEMVQIPLGFGRPEMVASLDLIKNITSIMKQKLVNRNLPSTPMDSAVAETGVR